MWVWTGVGALQNERTSSSLLFSRGAAQRRADCFVSTPVRPTPVLRASRTMGRGSVGSSLPFFRRARILPHVPRAVISHA